MDSKQPDLSRTNTVGFFAGAGIIAVAWTVAAILDAYGHLHLAHFIATAGFACFFACIGLAELRSGWAWKNMSPGGCGCHHSEHPHWYSFSVAGHFAIFIALVVVAFIVAFNAPRQEFDGTIHPGTAPR